MRARRRKPLAAASRHLSRAGQPQWHGKYQRSSQAMAAAVNALLQALPRLGDPLTIVAAFGVLGIFVGMAIALLCVRKGPAPTSLDQAVYKPFRLARKEEVRRAREGPAPRRRAGFASRYARAHCRSRTTPSASASSCQARTTASACPWAATSSCASKR